jgi:hypothetical protein
MDDGLGGSLSALGMFGNINRYLRWRNDADSQEAFAPSLKSIRVYLQTWFQVGRNLHSILTERLSSGSDK